jgi:polysaccharide export outer membrane protein
MKLFVRGLFACAALMAGLVISGCSSTPTGQLPDNSKPRAGAGVARFHVGDAVTVSFSGIPVPLPDHLESIKEDGNITLPLIGAIYALGKTAGELQTEIYTNYVPKYYVRLTVTVTSGIRVYYVGGEVHGAGKQQYVDGTTVTKAIQSAQGLTDFANHGKVWLIRASTGQRIRVNYDDALKDPAKDPPVYPDDQVNVERRIF